MVDQRYEPGEPIGDDELTALALAADPDAPLADDAVPISWASWALPATGGALPLWYMPPATTGAGRRWRVPFVVAIVAAFLLIEALGLCNTYGVLGL